MTCDLIGTRTLHEVRDHYQRYLFGEYLPFWSRHGVDHERGGFFCVLDHLMLMEHTEDGWGWEWFARIFEWIEAKCSLKPHGYPLYQVSGDRQMSFEPHANRKENYHHPRCVMRCLLALERMIGRR